MRKERKILRFVPQKLRKSFANGNPTENILSFKIFQNLLPYYTFKYGPESNLIRNLDLNFDLHGITITYTFIKTFLYI